MHFKSLWGGVTETEPHRYDVMSPELDSIKGHALSRMQFTL